MLGMKSDSSKAEMGSEEWSRDVINRLAFSALEEQRRTRRWNIFFKVWLSLYLLALLILYLPQDWDWGELSKVTEKHTALVDLRGVIADKSEASADTVIGGLRSAFEDDNTAGVIMRANSPGGSPVQSGYITSEMEASLVPEIPVGRVGRPDDIANAVVFFTSEQASWITGQVLFVHGGHRMALGQ